MKTRVKEKFSLKEALFNSHKVEKIAMKIKKETSF